jgi:UDP-glucose 4-epimerase
MALDEPCQGVLSTFIRRMVLGQPIEVFGDGRQLRDPLYVDDAVEAFLLAGSERDVPSSVYNVGGPAALELREIAMIACRAAGAPPPVCRPFPPERKSIDIGSYHTDSSRIARELGWRASTPFGTGIARTLEYYRTQLGHYLDRGGGGVQCKLLAPAVIQERRVAAR